MCVPDHLYTWKLCYSCHIAVVVHVYMNPFLEQNLYSVVFTLETCTHIQCIGVIALSTMPILVYCMLFIKQKDRQMVLHTMNHLMLNT